MMDLQAFYNSKVKDKWQNKIIFAYGKDYVEAFNFRVQITKHVKSVKEFKETIKCLFLLFFHGLF